MLLIQRIRITGMAVLVRLSLEYAYGGEMTGFDCGKEVLEIILMVGWSVMTNFCDRSWPRVARIRGGGVVLKPRVVRNVIVGFSRESGRASTAPGCAIRIDGREIESTHEGAPGHIGGAQQIPNVLSSHGDLVSSRV